MICNHKGKEVSVKDAAKIIFYSFGEFHLKMTIQEIGNFSKLDAEKCTDDEWAQIEEQLAIVKKDAAKYFSQV